MQQAGQRDGQAGGHGQPGRDADAPPDPDAPALPDGRADRRGRRRDRLHDAAKLAAQFLLVEAHGRIPSVRSALILSLARAREAWLFTLPTEQPNAAATSVSV